MTQFFVIIALFAATLAQAMMIRLLLVQNRRLRIERDAARQNGRTAVLFIEREREPIELVSRN